MAVEVQNHSDSIAIIGMAGKFPGAENIDAFWQNIRDGVESITFFTDDELIQSGVLPEALNAPNYVKAGAVIDGIDLFDASFFGFNPREAEITDPQHRLFLEASWQALEHAGYDPNNFDGVIGVFAGASFSSYLLNIHSNPSLMASVGSAQTMIGNDKDHLTTLVSYKLNLRGPSVAVQTACSTSLVSVHLACQSLLNRECDMVLAGGVSIGIPQRAGYFYQEGDIASPDGHCRAFDAEAKGTVSGNGLGLVVLKRLDHAIADRDFIHAIIRGSAINNDGAGKIGYTAPSVAGQAAVIAEALAVADVAPESISYIEAHGTGTTLGDPIEVAALTEAFRARTQNKKFCALGSVKTNVGHLDAAAGVTGLIKTVQALKHRLIPPSLHFKKTNSQIDMENSPFYVNTQLLHWDKNVRLAGVSSFGIGGTNAHVVLEEAPVFNRHERADSYQLIVLSARSQSALDKATMNLAEHLKTGAVGHLSDVSYTLQIGRKHFNHRLVAVCRDATDAVVALEGSDDERRITGVAESEDRPVAFMFSGQGQQFVNAGSELYRDQPVFKQIVDHCCQILRPMLGFDLLECLYPSCEKQQAVMELAGRTDVAQPALFVIEYALARLWMEWGVHPRAMIGHSLGEYVAATLAGVFTLEDALSVVAIRGKLMQRTVPGRMAAAVLSEEKARTYLSDKLSLAAINSSSQVVISGPEDEMSRLADRLQVDNVVFTLLQTSRAFHSQAVDAVIAPFLEHLKQISLSAPQIPFISNVTGNWIKESEATAPEYWARHMRESVLFNQGLKQLMKDQAVIPVEVAPGQTLIKFAHQIDPTRLALASLPRTNEQDSDTAFILMTLGHLWTEGVSVHWPSLHVNSQRNRVPLPTYPFERQRYWIEPQTGERKINDNRQTSYETIRELREWFYTPSWIGQRISGLIGHEMNKAVEWRWLIFMDRTTLLGDHLAKILRERGVDVITVTEAERFNRMDENAYSINPLQQNDYKILFKEVFDRSDIQTKIIYLWPLTFDSSLQSSLIEDDFGNRLFLSLLYMAQAFGDTNDSNPIEIEIVTNGLFDITGEEKLQPYKAIISGPSKVIPLEYPNIKCRNIDVAPDPSDSFRNEKMITHLLMEFLSEINDSVVAIRGSHRWVVNYTQIKLDQQPAPNLRLKQRGVYLITGGLGSMGLAFAEHLAAEVQAKLILVSRRSLPPRSEWDGLLSTARDIEPSTFVSRLDDLTDSIRELEGRITAESSRSKLSDFSGLKEALEHLCASYILSYFETCGVDTQPGTALTHNELRSRLKIIVKFEKFLSFMIKLLSERGVVRYSNGELEFTSHRSEIHPAKGLKQSLTLSYPQFKGLIDLLDHCAGNYQSALSGSIEAISVLYPEGDFSLLEDADKNTIDYSNESNCLTLVERIASLIAERSDGDKVKMLEVGAGSGGLTNRVIPSLLGSNIEYTFTDLGASFLIKARKEANRQAIDFMKFGIFDVSLDPVQQGYEPDSFDVVMAYNVVHATRDIEQTLVNMKKLLAPGGIMFLIEPVKSYVWTDMIWGLAEGWWYFEDHTLRPDSPLMSVEKWEATIRKAGFDNVASFDGTGEEDSEVESALLVARKPETKDGMKRNKSYFDNSIPVENLIGRITAMENRGADVMLASADVSDLNSMREVIAQAIGRFGEINGVIHTAGILGQGLIQIKDPDEALRVLSPKVKGTIVLDSLLKDSKLDFWLLCSSFSSISPTIGQVDYCAANCFLDAFANYKFSNGHSSIIAIDWGFWQELGMAAQASVSLDLKQKFEKSLKQSVKPDTGIEIFRRILNGCRVPQIIVSPEEIEKHTRSNGDLSVRDNFIEKPAKLAPSHKRPELHTPYITPRDETQARMAEIWQEVMGIERVGINDNFFELGGESLLGLQIISRIREHLNVPITLKSLFENPTIAALSEATEKSLSNETDIPIRKVQDYSDSSLLERLGNIEDESLDILLDSLLAEEERGQ